MANEATPRSPSACRIETLESRLLLSAASAPDAPRGPPHPALVGAETVPAEATGQARTCARPPRSDVRAAGSFAETSASQQTDVTERPRAAGSPVTAPLTEQVSATLRVVPGGHAAGGGPRRFELTAVDVSGVPTSRPRSRPTPTAERRLLPTLRAVSLPPWRPQSPVGSVRQRPGTRTGPAGGSDRPHSTTASQGGSAGRTSASRARTNDRSPGGGRLRGDPATSWPSPKARTNQTPRRTSRPPPTEKAGLLSARLGVRPVRPPERRQRPLSEARTGPRTGCRCPRWLGAWRLGRRAPALGLGWRCARRRETEPRSPSMRRRPPVKRTAPSTSCSNSSPPATTPPSARRSRACETLPAHWVVRRRLVGRRALQVRLARRSCSRCGSHAIQGFRRARAGASPTAAHLRGFLVRPDARSAD